MRGVPCPENSCCCSDCVEAPSMLVVNVSYPSGGGVMIPEADTPPAPPGEAPFEPEYRDVSTNCSRPGDFGRIRLQMISRGSGYTSAPTVSVPAGTHVTDRPWPPPGTAAGDCTLRGPDRCETARIRAVVSSPVRGYTITNGGSGYTSPPTVSIGLVGNTLRQASVTAVIAGAVTSVQVLSQGADYDSPPEVFADGGEGLMATAVMSGYIKAIQVKDGGQGYNSPPVVTIGGSPQTQATVDAVRIRQYVGSIELTNGGSGYTSPPSINVSGAGVGVVAVATISGGSVTKIDLFAKGAGALWFGSFPPLVVSITGGGGSGATATATPLRSVDEVLLAPGGGGAGYEKGVPVTLSGGGGSGATAVADVKFRVVSVTVQSGGTGYPRNADVTFSGGGGSGAAGRASIVGSVVALRFTDSGNYFISSESWSGLKTDWPTVSFSGGGGQGAAATLEFSGGLSLNVVGDGGSCYTSPPTITVSGGGGSGAEWEVSIGSGNGGTYSRRFEFCSAGVGDGGCSETFSDQYPLTPCGGCGGAAGNLSGNPSQCGSDEIVMHGEGIEWRVTAASQSPQRFAEFPGYSQPGWPLFTDVRDLPWLFPGEAVHVVTESSWTGGSGRVDERAIYLRRLFSRVRPFGRFVATRTTGNLGFIPPPLTDPRRLTHSLLPIGMTTFPDRPAIVRPEFELHFDLKGDPIWRITSLTVEDGGSGMILDGLIRFEPLDGNLIGWLGWFEAEFTTESLEPVVGGVQWFANFVDPPSFNFTLSEIEPGVYELAGVSVEYGGSGYPEGSGSLVGSLILEKGRARQQASILATLAGGSVTSVVVQQAGELLAPSSLTSASIPDEWSEEEVAFFEHPAAHSTVIRQKERIWVGSSNYRTEIARQAPTVSAEAGNASISVSLTSDAGEDGQNFWFVSGVTVVQGGESLTEGQPIALRVQGESPFVVDQPLAAWDGTKAVVTAAGKFFDRTIIETDDPLEYPDCLGVVSSTWEKRDYRTTSYTALTFPGDPPSPQEIRDGVPPFWPAPEAGESFEDEVLVGCAELGIQAAVNREWTRTRRCPLPVLEITLE